MAMFPNVDPSIVQNKLNKWEPPSSRRSLRLTSPPGKYITLFLVLVVVGLTTRNSSLRLLATNADNFRSSATSTKNGVLTRSISEHDVETGFTQSITITSNSPIYTQRSAAGQYIEIHESPHFGKILVLDGVTQLTERDGDSYNEMMAHVPLFQHPNPKRVLILGGGDGYILSEVLKHASVEYVDHVDLDGDVIEVCQRFFKWGNAWNDTRVHLHIEDGAKFVKHAKPGSYDVVIQDSSDPWTSNEDGETVPLPSGTLYAPQHYSNIYKVLANDGILNFQVCSFDLYMPNISFSVPFPDSVDLLIFSVQAETMQIPADFEGAVNWRQSLLSNGFKRVRYGTITIPTYPTGQIGFMLCENRLITTLPII